MTTSTGVGGAITLLVVGAFLTFALQADIPNVDEGALGIVLMVVGVLWLVLTLVMEWQRQRTRHVVERRY